MSFGLEVVPAIVGAAVSVLGVFVSVFLKKLSDKHLKRDRDIIQKAARNRLSEISISVAGLGISYQLERHPTPDTQVATQLLKEVEQGIVEGVAGGNGLSREQVQTEVDNRMTEVRERLANIEKRFPNEGTIDKIASINDALFAQRIEQISARIDKIEEKLLTKWDVALIVSSIAAGIFAVVGATYAVLKVFGLTTGQ